VQHSIQGKPVSWLRQAGVLSSLILALGVIIKFPEETALRFFESWWIVGSAKLSFVLPLKDIGVVCTPT
jgi:hypothetical protein